MDVTLPFVGLSHEQIGDVPSDAILVGDSISTEYFLESRARQ
jgi:hypothetical protein